MAGPTVHIFLVYDAKLFERAGTLSLLDRPRYYNRVTDRVAFDLGPITLTADAARELTMNFSQGLDT